MIKPRLIIFAKAPVLGGAKTRLAKGIGKTAAWRWHRAMMAKIVKLVQSPCWVSILAVSPDRAVIQHYPGIWPLKLLRVGQGSGDLGERQHNVFSTGKGPICVIGTDSPEIKRHDIATAFGLLKRYQAVIGPAADGGYWLLALRSPVPNGVFDHIRWSSSNASNDLVSQLNKYGVTKIAYLRPLADIDYLEDLKRLQDTR